MSKHPNQGGGSNRQGPKITSGGKRGPIVGKMSSFGGGSQKPFRGDKGTSSGAGRNMSGSNWKKRPPH